LEYIGVLALTNIASGLYERAKTIKARSRQERKLLGARIENIVNNPAPQPVRLDNNERRIKRIDSLIDGE
jgi:hypothetical protein